MSELLILAVIILIFIGPKELPEVARVIGRMLNEFKRASGDLKESLLDPKRHIEEVLNEKLDPNHRGDVLPEVKAPDEKLKVETKI